MKKVIRFSWAVLGIWAVLMVLAIVTMPNTGELVRDKGQMTVSHHYSSMIASDIEKEMSKSGGNGKDISAIMVYYKKGGLNNADKNAIRDKVDRLDKNRSRFHITSLTDPLSNHDLTDKFLSKDGTTLLIPIAVQKGSENVNSIRNDLVKQLKTGTTAIYSTGSDMISEDFVETTESGIQKTELISIVFILVVLLLIFRSPVTPIATLVTVGLSFLVSLNVVMQLVKFLSFPISSFSQIFLVLILFGIGTDYSMLLLMRFKEELSNGAERKSAILTTYKTAGKTVFFSSLTILIGFSCLYFAQFTLFKSATAVAVGVAVLILVLFTFIPALMQLLGQRLFWSPFPSKSHGDSKLWRRVTLFSTHHPYVAFLLVGAVCCSMFLYNGTLSYNSVTEVDPSYPSIIGNNIVSKHFSQGETMPVTVAIKSNGALNTLENLSAIDRLIDGVRGVKGVDKVYGVTQPLGSRMDLLYLNNQIKTVNNGLTTVKTGITTISGGMKGAGSQLSSVGSAAGAVQQLQNGTNGLTDGLQTVASFCDQLKNGMSAGTQGAGELADKIAQLDAGVDTLDSSFKQLQSAYTTIGSGCKTLLSTVNASLDQMNELLKQNNLSSVKQATDGVQSADSQLNQLQNALVQQQNGFAQKYGLQNDPQYQSMVQTSQGIFTISQGVCKTSLLLGSSLSQTTSGLSALSGALQKIDSGMDTANSGLSQAVTGMDTLQSAASLLKDGSAELSSKLSEASDGQAKITDAMQKLLAGAQQLGSGQAQFGAAITKLAGQSQQMGTALNAACDGLSQASGGLSSANDYLGGLSGASTTAVSLYIPPETINGADFTKTLDSYMSSNRHITTLTITLGANPYSQKAMSIVNNLSKTVNAYTQTSSLKNAQWGIDGVTQGGIDLGAMSGSDFHHAAAIMLIGIFLVLLFITREFWMPVFVMGGLLLAYYIAISLSGFFFSSVLHFGNLSYNVPFCSFIMIVSLGVDYSIFLIMRHKENKGMPFSKSIITAASKVGGVIMSAAFILSGTFAAMYPSGVRTLMEVAITVILGIVLLCFILLPVFIPTMMSIKEKLLPND